jgi:hypothetical protein
MLANCATDACAGRPARLCQGLPGCTLQYRGASDRLRPRGTDGLRSLSGRRRQAHPGRVAAYGPLGREQVRPEVAHDKTLQTGSVRDKAETLERSPSFFLPHVEGAPDGWPQQNQAHRRRTHLDPRS